MTLPLKREGAETSPSSLSDGFSFAGHSWRALSEGALYWQDREALIVADLHFEKASAYARMGQMLPPYDSHATLDALEAAIARHRPAEVWCLGDSFHDMGAHDRMHDDISSRLRKLTQSTRWTWITGNHDPGCESVLGGDVLHEAIVNGIMFRHEAIGGEKRPEISGHYHPKFRIKSRGRHISRRCFVMGNSKLIVPAFGALTGGLDAASSVFGRLLGEAAEALVSTQGQLLRFPMHR